MNLGFEVTAATPKRLRAVEDAPAAESMRGERKITQAPSTDQKKVRRAMTRKTAHQRDIEHAMRPTAVMNDVGDCRLCGGDLVPKSRDGSTVKAECAECGTEHSLQRQDPQHGRTAAQTFATFQNLSAHERDRLRVIAWWHENNVTCPHCKAKNQHGIGWASGDGGNRMMLRCPDCEHNYQIPVHHDFSRIKSKDVGRTASSETARLLSFVGSTWVPVVDTSPYLVQPVQSAIARRAQSVLDLKENS